MTEAGDSENKLRILGSRRTGERAILGDDTMIAQSLALALAAGLSPYATIALVGLFERMGWIGTLPGPLAHLANPWLFGFAAALATIEFVATLVPWVATTWDAVHTAIRPPAATALAIASAWGADPALIAVAGLLGGTLGLTSHFTKLGLRVAVDSSPEPMTNGLMNSAELGVIASVSYFVWNHPVITLGVALAFLLVLMLTVRAIWRSVKRFVNGVGFGEESSARR